MVQPLRALLRSDSTSDGALLRSFVGMGAKCGTTNRCVGRPPELHDRRHCGHRWVAPLLATVLSVLPGAGARAQQLSDPGPVWEGITDTTSFGIRMERHLAAAGKALDVLRAVEGPRTVANTVIPYNIAKNQLNNAGLLARLALHTHPDAGFRAYVQTWQERIAGQAATFGGDRALYEALAAVDLSDADPGLRYVVERDLEAYRRNGIDRSAEVRARIAALRAQITALGTRFENNIFSDRDTLRVHTDSLQGMPEDWLAAHPAAADGLVTIEITPASSEALITFAERQSIREAAFRGSVMAGSAVNAPVVDSLRALRHELATLLGYPSWAAYAAAPMMAGSPERIRRFLDEVDEASAEATRRELAEMLARRRAEQPGAEGIDVPSFYYWRNRVKREAYAFDEQTMREYLPYSRVRDGVLASFERMYGLEFRPSPETPVWSPAVEAYEVWEDGTLVGRFYLDMHPREGKFGAGAQFDLRVGGGALPEAALVVNMPGGDGNPGLLQPSQMMGFFHEFGHLVHALFRGRSAIVGDVERDFIEAPAQMMDEWALDPEVLRSFARHYQTNEPIPEELIAAYRRAQGFGRASRARLALWLAGLSFELHEMPPAEDPTADVEARVVERYAPFEVWDGFSFSTSLPQLNRYSSNQYTYLWSEVIARDLLARFNREDLLDSAAGRRYRELVLAPSGRAPTGALIERFLGRPFNADAWRTWLESGEGSQ